MSYEKVQQALIQHFATGFPAWLATQVAWPNVTFTPPAAQPWMAFMFGQNDESIATLGPDGYDELNGFIQIDVNYPVGGGEKDSRQTINLLRTCFKPQVIQYDGQSVTILSRGANGGREQNGFFSIPFTVRFRSHILRNS